MIVCKSCGTANPEQAFCGSCGVRLELPTAAPIELVPPPVPPQQFGTAQITAALIEPNTVPSKARPKWLIPAIGIALAAAVVAGVVASKDDSSKGSDTADSTQATTKATARPTTTELTCPFGQHATPFGECELDPTTTIEEPGSRDNPLSPNFLTYGDYDPVTLGSLEPVDFSAIEAANRFNDAPPAGQIYVRYKVTATYNGTSTGAYFDFAFNLGLVGDKGKIYEPAFVSDSDGTLDALSDQPDVIAGGTMSGYLYYLIDADDTNILVVNENSDGNVFIDITG